MEVLTFCPVDIDGNRLTSVASGKCGRTFSLEVLHREYSPDNNQGRSKHIFIIISGFLFFEGKKFLLKTRNNNNSYYS